MAKSEGLVALALGGDNPHASGWLETLKNCPSIDWARWIRNNASAGIDQKEEERGRPRNRAARP